MMSRLFQPPLPVVYHIPVSLATPSVLFPAFFRHHRKPPPNALTRVVMAGIITAPPDRRAATRYLVFATLTFAETPSIPSQAGHGTPLHHTPNARSTHESRAVGQSASSPHLPGPASRKGEPGAIA